MEFGKDFRGAVLASIVCCAMLSPAGAVAVTFTEFVDPHPAPGNVFGATVLPLSTGNVVITSPFDDAGGTDAGAAYLFNGATGALISTLVGSAAGDIVGGSVVALSNGNYLVLSNNWDNGAIVDAGAVTWGSGTTGVSGVVSASNSLVGSTAHDNLGNQAVGGVTALSNGNYVVVCSIWDNGAIVDAGAATWGSGTTGVTGVISAANSLVGSTDLDLVGDEGVVPLSNGSYVVISPYWGAGNAGAVTWGSGTTGVSGAVSSANSLVGSASGDLGGILGRRRVLALSNGNYVVTSPEWDNGVRPDAGAVTWGSGTTGVSGVVSAANSLVGALSFSFVGEGVTELSNGNYVVHSPRWGNSSALGLGAATWGSGTTGVSGVVSAANSLVGSKGSDYVAYSGVTALSNGNYVVSSPYWDNSAAFDAGAATWCNGTTGVTGVVSAPNSLIGSTAFDNVGLHATALSNGNYVVGSPYWDNGAIVDAGAATWASGMTGVTGVVSAANSLVGSSSGDVVTLNEGEGPTGAAGVTALSNGNYVVASPGWNIAGVKKVGATTWGNGTTGVIGMVSAANSLVGSTAYDRVGSEVTALANGNFVVLSKSWDNGANIDVGAATWGSGTTGASGVVSAANSLVGSGAYDNVGDFGTVTALSNGNYVVLSQYWDNGAIVDVGAATWGSGTTGVTGLVSAANSLIGSTPADFFLSGNIGVTDFNGNYVVASSSWDNGGLEDAGAATWGNGTTGVSGVISAANSLVGTTANTVLQPIVVDVVNNTFIAPFVSEGGGRVRVGPPEGVVSVVAGNTVALALEGVRPNPTKGNGLHVAFVLPSGAPARLELLDVSGRRVLARDVGSLGAGRHTVDLAAGRKIASGIYWVRLVQGANNRTTNVAVIR